MDVQIVDEPHEMSLSQHLDSLLIEKKGQEALDLMRNPNNEKIIHDNSADLINVVIKYLTDENLVQQFSFHRICEDILIEIAAKGKEDMVVVELLELIDFTYSDNLVVSALKALQTYLLRGILPEKPHRLDWVLGTIQQHANEFPLSVHLRKRLDDEEEKLLEEEDEVKRILSFYIHLDQFYPSIASYVMQIEPPNQSNFRDMGQTLRNTCACFIIQLFGVPFACLNLSSPPPNTNALTNDYSRERVTKLVGHLTTLIPNPIQLISYGQRRALWPFEFTDDPDLDNRTLLDIFLLDAKVSITSLAIVFYALFAENLLQENTPRIYRNVYLLEMGLYFATDLLASSDETLRTKGIRLADKLLENLQLEQLEDDTLELDIHKKFTIKLLEMLNSTQVRRNSKNGVELLKKYIGKFKSISARYFHIQHLFDNTANITIRSLLATFYKNQVADELNAVDAGRQTEVSEFCCGEKLRWNLFNRICVLPEGVETDLLNHNDLIVTALNTLMFLVIRDKNNATKIWDFIDEIEMKFLVVVRDALNITSAHYKLEERRIKEKSNDSVNIELNVSGFEQKMTKETELEALAIGHNKLHLIEYAYSRLNEKLNAIREKSENNKKR